MKKIQTAIIWVKLFVRDLLSNLQHKVIIISGTTDNIKPGSYTFLQKKRILSKKSNFKLNLKCIIL